MRDKHQTLRTSYISGTHWEKRRRGLSPIFRYAFSPSFLATVYRGRYLQESGRA